MQCLSRGLLVALWAILGYIQHTTCDNRRGLLVTSTNRWVKGIPNKICMTSYHMTSAVRVTISVHQVDDVSTVFNTTEVVIPAGGTANTCTSITLNNVFYMSGQLSIRARSHDNSDSSNNEQYTFERNATIEIRDEDVTTFIETDKFVYKPSDTVRFRILTISGPEAKLVTDKVSLVTVEDPSRTRVMQWTDVETSNGLVQLELPLSNEPPFGDWTVNTWVNRMQQTATFVVKEYVLPKFEVNIVHPSYIDYQQNVTTWKVCARYTYGEPVAGEVQSTSICSKHRYDDLGRTRQCVNVNLNANNARLSDGCAEFTTERTRSILPSEYWMVSTRQINITAEVKERGTGVILSGSQLITIVTKTVQIELSPHNRPYFKPGFAYHGTGSLLKPDKTPCDKIHQVVVVASELYNETIATDAQGRFTFTISADVLRSSRSQSVDIQIHLTQSSISEYDLSRKYSSLQPWYSPSNSYMQIDSPDGVVQQCGSLLRIPVSYVTDDLSTSGSLSFTYQIVSRGNIVTSEVSATAVSSATGEQSGPISVNFVIDVNVTAMMSGSFDVIVFHIRSDGETVADTAHISVEQCFRHQVSMQFAANKVQPGHETSVHIAADVASLCAVSVVDKSVELMGKTTVLTADKVDGTRQRYHTSREYSHFYSSSCERPQNDTDDTDTDDLDAWQNAELRTRRTRPRRASYARSRRWSYYTSRFIDADAAFHYAGIIALSDLDIKTRPCQRMRMMPYYYASVSRTDGAIRPVMLASPGLQGPEMMPDMMSVQNSPRTSSSQLPQVTHRTYFPETWLWKLDYTGNSNHYEIPVTVPHTITEWIGNGYCVNAQSGIGVSKPFKVTAFQPFFISFTLPYSLVRGESVVIPVTVFNYMADQCLQVTLQVKNSTSFELRKANARSPFTADIAQLKVCSRQSETHSFRLVARQLGRVNFTVMGSSELFGEELANTINEMEEARASDTVTQQLLVISEGKEEELVRSVYTCGLQANSYRTSGNWSLTLADDVISDSVRTSVNVIGDVMGSALSDLDKLLTLPTGCGEQNMLKFAPNIYVLEYLSRTDQLTDEIKTKAVGFLQTGYQRELTYRHHDGSYSAFGNSDPEGSIWLTAFVVRSFARARAFIFIDDNDLDTSIRWIRAQQMANGCFQSVGKVLHKAMTGGLQHDESNVSLTAYIVISLLEANTSSTDVSIVNAFRCINEHSTNEIYAASLLAYAYSLNAGDVSGKRDVMDFIGANAVQKAGMKYWQSRQRGETEGDYSYMTSSSSAADIELTSYILLSSLANPDNEIDDTVPIVRWLSTQRNAYGGFSSTQDTILALQALSAFATRVFRSGSDLDLAVSFAGQGHGNLRCQGRRHCRRHQFVVNNSNRLVRQQSADGGFKLPTTVEWTANGTGCALLQVAVKYNRAVTSVETPAREAFILNVTVEQVNANSCKTMRLAICASYNGDDSASNMAIVAIKMVSGWIPDKASINKLKGKVNDVNFGTNYIKRVEVDEKNVVNVYFDEFDKSQRCFALDVMQEIIVNNAKPSLVHVYDYYTPGTSVFASYALSTNSCTSTNPPRRQSADSESLE